MSIPLDNLPPKLRAQALAQIEAEKRKRHPIQFIHPEPAAKKRLRQNSKGLNKTEQAFLEYMKSEVDPRSNKVCSQSYTLLLGNGVRYTPDVSECYDGGKLAFYEVKGFMRDDAAVKIKVAASLYPEHKFYLVTKRKGEWDFQYILP